MTEVEALLQPAAVDVTPSAAAKGRNFLRELAHSGTGLAGALFLLIVVLCAIFAGLIAPHDPNSQDLANRLARPVFFGGHWNHPLGTDQLGRDLFSRMLFGARVTMIVACSVVALAGSLGVFMGLISGYFGGWADRIIMRFADTQLAFPGLLLALIILYTIGPSVKLLVIVLAINGWLVYARIVRGLVLGVKSSEYIEAAEISGVKSFRIMIRHIIPNIASPVLTLLVLEFARIILAEASLSFLGYGVQPPESSWGLIIGQGQDYLTTDGWLVAIPGITICLTVLSANLLASWLRIYADPKQRERRFGKQLDELAKVAG
ncbi:MAG TPA: ABC transporter permease [Mycobacteriales bacterium]|nr:ABC transporter permease [Mycobacteriales bacterium]